MPYIIEFVRLVPIAGREQYINDCCVGGDVVLDRLLPALRERYGRDLQSNQEDWGWYVWFEQPGARLAVDIHTDNHASGQFRLHLTSRRRRRVFGARIVDTAELEQLRQLVLSQLRSWPVQSLQVACADHRYIPAS